MRITMHPPTHDPLPTPDTLHIKHLQKQLFRGHAIRSKLKYVFLRVPYDIEDVRKSMHSP